MADRALWLQETIGEVTQLHVENINVHPYHHHTQPYQIVALDNDTAAMDSTWRVCCTLSLACCIGPVALSGEPAACRSSQRAVRFLRLFFVCFWCGKVVGPASFAGMQVGHTRVVPRAAPGAA